MADQYYYSNGKRIPVRRMNAARVVNLTEDRNNISVSGWNNVSIGQRNHILIIKSDTISEVSFTNNTLRELDIFVQQAEDRYISTSQPGNEENLPGRPVLVDGNGSVLMPTSEIVVQFANALNEDGLIGDLRELGVTSFEELEFVENGYVLELDANYDPVEVSRMLVESKLAIFAHPNFIENIHTRDHISPSALFKRQWHLLSNNSIGTRSNVDINATKAWEVTLGNPEIVVCILDGGIESSHEAFSEPGKLTNGYDFVDDDDLADPNTSSHGTSCAGLVGASGETSKTVGVAPRCRLMPIRRPSVTEHLKLAKALYWASKNGADVINCSFGIDGRPWVLPDVVRAVLEEVTRSGRDGLGCVVVWAAGNGNEDVSSDQWSTQENVITVAASTDQNLRAFYSDYGEEIDICAPSSGGINGITTTRNGGYWSQFGGTSAAAPLVAGVAALILSINSELKASEVKSILLQSADKISPRSGKYDARGHSVYFGFGKLNAWRSLINTPVLAHFLKKHDMEGDVEKFNGIIDDFLYEHSSLRPIEKFILENKFKIIELSKNDDDFDFDFKEILHWIVEQFDGSLDKVPDRIFDILERLIGKFLASVDV